MSSVATKSFAPEDVETRRRDIAMLLKVKLANSMTLVLFLATSVGVGAFKVSREFHRTFAVSLAEPVILQVDLLGGDLRIAYAHDGEVSISISAQNASSTDLESLSTRLVMAQSGNQLDVWERPGPGHNPKLTYSIDVPYRTEVHTSLRRGKQTITGLMGPVTGEIGVGDIEASYISLGVTTRARTGNLIFEMVGGSIEARTDHGKIACQRAPQGISAETGDGDISLAAVGASAVVVKSGKGRIDVRGARGSLLASTLAGDLYVNAVPHENWQLSSGSGTIHLELPPRAGFDLDANTTSGQLTWARDLTRPDTRVRHFTQKVNSGGKRIDVRSDSGDIVIE